MADCATVKVVYPGRRGDCGGCAGCSKKLKKRPLCPSSSIINCGAKIDSCTEYSLVSVVGVTALTLDKGLCLGQIKYIKNATANNLTITLTGVASTGSIVIPANNVAMLQWNCSSWDVLLNAAVTVGAT